jgi:hypothetical protein
MNAGSIEDKKERTGAAPVAEKIESQVMEMV